MTRPKVVIATKDGGHAIEARGVMVRFSDAELIIVTSPEDRQDYGVKRYEIPPFRRIAARRVYPLRLVRNALGALRVLLRERPDVVVCCGANNALLLGIFARWFGVRVIAIESINRVRSPSKTPQILSRFGAEVWIAHEALEGRYAGDTVLVGMIHPHAHDLESFRSKDRDIALTIVPSSADHLEGEGVVKDLGHEDLLRMMGRSRTVVTRGGVAAWEAAHLADEVVLVPLENADGSHQIDFAEWLLDRFENVRRGKSLEHYVARSPGDSGALGAARDGRTGG